MSDIKTQLTVPANSKRLKHLSLLLFFVILTFMVAFY